MASPAPARRLSADETEHAAHPLPPQPQPAAPERTGERAPPPAAAVAASLGAGELPSMAAAEAHAAAARAALAAGVPGEFLLRGAPIAMAAEPAATSAPPSHGRGGSGLAGKPAAVVTQLAGAASQPSPRAPQRAPSTPPPSPSAGPGPGAASLGLEAAEEFPEVPSLGPGTKGAVGTADHRFARRSRAASAPPAAHTPPQWARPSASEAASPSGVPPPGTVRRTAAAYGAAAVAGAADVNCTLWRNGERGAAPVPLTKARLRARKHGGALLPTVQEALDTAAAEGRGPPKGASQRRLTMICRMMVIFAGLMLCCCVRVQWRGGCTRWTGSR